MGAVRVFLEILLVIVALALIYVIVNPFKAEVKAYINSIGNRQVSELLYIGGYIVYKLGYLSYTLLELIAKYSLQALQYLLNNLGVKIPGLQYYLSMFIFSFYEKEKDLNRK